MIVFLILFLTRAVISGNAILCTYKTTSVCYVKIPKGSIFDSGTQTAPVPKDLSYNYIDDDEDYINVTWKQKGSELPSVQGYYLQITSSSGMDADWRFQFNESMLTKDIGSSQPEVIFSFDKVNIDLQASSTVTLYSLPLYNVDSKDHREFIVIEPKETTNILPSLYEPKFESRDEEPNYKTPFVSSKGLSSGDEFTLPEKSHTDKEYHCTVYIILACIIATLVTAIVVTGVMKACRQLQKPKGIISTSESQRFVFPSTPQESFIKEDQKIRVLILTSSANAGIIDRANAGSEFFKKVALCLASTLHSSGDFDVSCNLWMVEEIAEKGIAIWAHDIIKTHNKVIILCNPGVKIQPEQLVAPQSSEYESDAFNRLIRNLIRSAHCDSSKFIVACAEEAVHSCFAGMALPTLHNCKHINVHRNFYALVNALSQRKMGRRKVELMNQSFIRMVEKLRMENCNTAEEGKKQVQLKAVERHGPVPLQGENIKLLDETKHSKSGNRFNDKRYRNLSASSATDGNMYTEIQFDSVYSSRCNSHSTETLSSGEDAALRVHSGSPTSTSKPQYAGARPKTRA